MQTRQEYKEEYDQFCEKDKNQVLQSIGDIFICLVMGKDSLKPRKPGFYCYFCIKFYKFR